MARGYGDRTGSDYRPENNDRWRDEDRERSSWRSGRPGTSEREDERGFFERAGDEIRSWFGDDDDRTRHDYERGRPGGWSRDRDLDRGNSPRSSWDRESDRERGYGRTRPGTRDYSREDRSTFGGMAQGGLGRSGGGFDRDRDRRYGPSRGGAWTGTSDRDRSSIGGSQSWNRDRDDRDQPAGVVMYEEYSETLGGFGNQRFGSSQDDHYRSWRDRQMAQLDRDYDDYCREREQQFHQDFDSWRRNRPQDRVRTSSASSSDIGISSNAGVGTTTASLSGTSGGSAVRSSTSPSPAESGTTTSTEDATSGSGASRSGSKSRS